MTLAEKLAREAAPCSAPIICGKRGDYKHVRMCSRCTSIPAIQAAIEKAIRACHIVALEQKGEAGVPWTLACDAVGRKLYALLTDDVEDGG